MHSLAEWISKRQGHSVKFKFIWSNSFISLTLRPKININHFINYDPHLLNTKPAIKKMLLNVVMGILQSMHRSYADKVKMD